LDLKDSAKLKSQNAKLKLKIKNGER